MRWPRSWLVLGGFILFAAGLLGVLWLLAGLVSNLVALQLLAWPMVVVAAATAGYSAFLFGQAEGRDFWQSPLLLPHLLVAALVAGAATLLVVGIPAGGDRPSLKLLAATLIVALVLEAGVLFAELSGAHANVDAVRAARLLTHGALSRQFWWGVVVAGV